MPRIRTVKPGFFTDCDIGALDPYARLLFLGLLTQADREGRLKDKPKEIKTMCLPYDNADVEVLLDSLAQTDFITRYEVDGKHYIEISGFAEHQRPHHTEPASVLPGPLKKRRISVATPSSPRRKGEGKGKDNGKGKEEDMSAAPTAPCSSSPDDEIFDYWRLVTCHPDAKFDTKRRTKVKARLADGYSVEALKEAIDGCRASPWHQGENDRQTKYDDLELICRDAQHVEAFRELSLNPRPKGNKPNGQKETASQRNVRLIRESAELLGLPAEEPGDRPDNREKPIGLLPAGSRTGGT